MDLYFFQLEQNWWTEGNWSFRRDYHIYTSYLRKQRTLCLQVLALTLAGRGGAAPKTLFAFFCDYSGDVCDGELKLGMIDARFNPDMMHFHSFSGQVRSLTYDVIITDLWPMIYDVIGKPPQVHKMSQRSNAVNAGQSFWGRWKLKKTPSSRVLTFCISRIFRHMNFRL